LKEQDRAPTPDPELTAEVGQTVDAAAPNAFDLPGAVEQSCANHPGRMTMVTCSTCSKPICPDCMVYSAVGIKCAECARMPRSSRVTIKRNRLAWAIVAGLWAGTAVGFAYYYILGAVNFFFFFFFVAAGIGYLIGEAVKRASGHYRGKATAVVAAASTIWAFVLPPLVSGLISLGASWNVVVFALTGRGIINWVVMAFSANLAWSRNR
jgi:hypothetical protein